MVLDGLYFEWELCPEDINRRAKDLIVKTRRVYDQVADVSTADVNLENVLMVLAYNDYSYSLESNIIEFAQHVSVQKDVRTASTEADKLLSEFSVEMSMRQDVFNNLVALQTKGLDMNDEATRYLEKLLKNGKRNGLHLSKEIQIEIKNLKKRASDISIEFNKNCNEENTVLEFTKDQLCGMPQDFINGLKKTESGEKYFVSLKYPEYFPCMKNARNPDTRKMLDIAFNRRCIDENTPILEELVKLRHKKANLLGFPTHAAFVTETRMSKTAGSVHAFLNELAAKMKPLGDKDISTMLRLKKEECDKYGYEFDNKINSWDMHYYMNLIERHEYSVDHEKLKEYFPLHVVTSGLFGIYQELLSVKFEQILSCKAWHEDVSTYSVHDSESGKLIGYFYLDLFPREGKFSHAACFGLQPGCRKKDGNRMIAVVAMVVNFTKPLPDKPSLLTHEEVETFFHEFGHVMHYLCSETELSYFSGTKVERDFVEAPSQMLENWCWEEASLKRMSKHYQDGSELPGELLEKLIKSRNANAGVFNLRQIALGTFDQLIHTRESADTAQLLAIVFEEILGIPQAKDTNKSAAFGHLADGYDAQYYGYLWSEVYSMDMFCSRFKKEGIMSAVVGRAYREQILKPGGSLDATVMLKNFLGRDPNQEAFLRSKGLDPTTC